jgi:anti-sigma factor RsiW
MIIFRKDGHLTDEALLLLDEGAPYGSGFNEPVHDELKAFEHLATCDSCCQRLALLQKSAELLSNASLPTLPPTSDPAARARLVAALEQEFAAQRQHWWRRPAFAMMVQPRMLMRVGIVAALLVLSVAFRQAYSPMQDRMGAFEETGPEPNHALTPGAANPVQLAELCVLEDNDLDPAVSPDKERAVFQAYGMDEKAAKAYQVDYLINPQLGGNDALGNLWPEPYHATVWNATAKDALETRLHGMVCSGQVDLATAQHDLSTDWVGAYKKYFHTQRPVKTVAEVDDFVGQLQ